MAQSRSYTTQGGETLQNLAQMFLGDKDFWYLIAALNGLDSPDEALPQGKVLHIPAQGTASNSSDAFNPINLNEVLENYLPEAAFVPPPQKGCNAVASIIMIVVAVIATIYTAGAASSLFSATAISGAGGIGAAGAAALGGTVAGAGIGAAMGAAAIGGFVGSVASQLVGKALGAVDSFSLKGALTSGLTAGATAGAGSMLQGADWATKGAEGNQIFNNYGKAALAATATATSVAAGKLVGQQSSFRWGNVAASAVAAGITGDAGIIGQGSLNPVNGIFNAGIRYGADKLFGNEASWNFDAVAVDAFGNAIGNSIVAGMQNKQTQTNANKAKDIITTAVENGATPQDAVQQVAQQIASENGGIISGGRAGFTDEYTGTGTTITNSKGETAEFFIDNATTVQSGYNLIESMSDFLGSSPDSGMMLGMATNQIIGQTQRHHDARMNSIQHLDMSKYKLGGVNGVFDRPAMVGIPGVTPGPWAPEFLQGTKGSRVGFLNTISQPSGIGPWSEGYIFPKESQLLSNVSSVADWTSAIAQSGQIANEFAARSKIINMLNSSKGIPVNSLRIDYLKNVSVPLSMAANTYAPITSAKSFEVLAKLNGTFVYSSLNTVSKYAPGVYAASQLGSEVYYAVENDVSLDIASRNVGSRALGTAVELGGGLASFKVGAVAGVAGTLTYTFSGLGTTINNTVTDTTREIIGWFNE